MLPEDVTENRKQWKQTAPGTLLNVLAKAELSNDSFIQLEEEIGRMSGAVNYTRFPSVCYYTGRGSVTRSSTFRTFRSS